MLNERNIPLEEDGIEEEILVEDELAITKAMWGDIGGNIENQTDLQNALDAKQDDLTEAQLNAVNSGITAGKVATYDGYADQIASKANQSALNAEATTREQADTALGTRIDNEALARQRADNGLQTQIDAITSKSDVVDVVANYAALQAYDTSTLSDKDVVKVLDDETHEDALTYYRWSTTTQTWSYIGQEAPYYSKGQMDVKLAEKQDKLTAGANIQIQNGTISATDTTYTAGNGLNINGTEFSADTDVLATKDDLEDYYTKPETDNLLAPKLETELVAELPSTGEEGKLYLTPKAHTTQTATGNPITATVAEEAGAIESFQLDGDTFQQAYSGAQIVKKQGFATPASDTVFWTITNATQSDISSDGFSTFTFSGTGYKNFFIKLAGSDIKASTTYTVIIELDEATDLGYFVITQNNTNSDSFPDFTVISLPDGVSAGSSGGATNGAIYLAEGSVGNIVLLGTTRDELKTQTLRFYASGSASDGKKIRARVSIIEGDHSSDWQNYCGDNWQPYVGGVASPNPTFTQAVNTVTGTQTVEVVGKNLLNPNMLYPVGYSETINGVTYTMMEDGGIKMKGTAGSTASSFTFLGVSWSDTTNQIPLDGSKAYMSSITRPNSAYRWYLRGYVNGAVATLNSNLDSLAISNCTGITYAMLQVSANQAVDAVVYPQVELGSTATSFAKYSKQTLPIDLGTTELCKLGDYQDYIYKDGESWKVHKATGVKNYTGESSENWSYFSSSGYTIWRSTDVPTNMQSSAITTDSFKSNNFTYWVNDGTSVSVGVTEGHFGFNAAATNINFKYDSLEPNLSDWTTWLSTHNTSVYYPLATATDTTITDQTLIAQLEAVRTALLQNGANTITNTATGTNLAGDMEVGYYGYNPTNRYDKWLWLDINNEYEQIGS